MPIQLLHIYKQYGDKPVLCDVNLTFPVRGLFHLQGASGSGKTTLLRLIAGLEPPDRGEILGLDGLKVSVVFQEHRLLPQFTVLENVAFVSDTETARQWLTRVELRDAAGQYPAQLSGGMKRRASLARALAYGGDVLLLDEPFNGLDIPLRERILPHLQEFAQHALVILVSHEEQAIPGIVKTYTLLPVQCPAEPL